MLSARGLSVSYGLHRALEGASVRVGKGEIVVILGANGAGKSTLLKAVAGICEGRVAGEIVMDGADISGLPPHRIVDQGVALVPEGRGVFADLTVQENLTLGAYSSRARDEEAGNLERVLGLFPKLRERRRQVVRTMSGGEQQMVAIGRAMMSNPQILMLDEPSLGLSPLLCKELFQSLKAVRDGGLGILLVEQNAKQSLAIADRGYLLENGQIVHENKAAGLLNDPAVQRAYLGGGGAAAPLTHRGPERKAPVPAPSLPRPAAGPSPSDIAAAAMRQFGQRQPPVSSPASNATPAPVAAPPATLAAAPAPAAPPLPSSAPSPVPGGIRIEDLVARAAAIASSRPQAGPAKGATPARPLRGGAPIKLPPTPMPDLAASGDRLRAVLKEIEEAAARARAHRPPKE